MYVCICVRVFCVCIHIQTYIHMPKPAKFAADDICMYMIYDIYIYHIYMICIYKLAIYACILHI